MMNFTTVYNACMSKQADALADAAGGGFSGLVQGRIPYAGHLASLGNFGGFIHGYSTYPEEINEAELDEHPLQAVIPGVGVSRIIRRKKKQLSTPKGETRRFWSSEIGPLVTTALPILAGAGIGAGIGGKPGAATGLAAGAGVAGGAAQLAALLAAATKTRTKKQQREAAEDTKGVVKDQLIPGHAFYNQFKSIGRSLADTQERAKKQQAASEKAKKAKA